MILLYGAGFITDKSELDTRAFARYLNMNIQPVKPGATRLKLADNTFGSYFVSEPRFAVTGGSGVRVLGRYLDGGAVGLAEKQFGKARLIFCGTPELDEKFLAETLKKAGGHLYSATGDICFAGYGVVTLHSRSAGQKTVWFPEAVDVWDVFENKMVARNVKSYSFSMPALETRVFLTGKNLVLEK